MSGGESRGSPRWSVVTPATAVPRADGGAAGEEGHGLGRPAVVGQGAEVRGRRGWSGRCCRRRRWDPAGAAGADQVVGAGDAGWMPPPMSMPATLPGLPATIVSVRVTCPVLRSFVDPVGVAADRAGDERRRAEVFSPEAVLPFVEVGAGTRAVAGVAADRAVGERRRAASVQSRWRSRPGVAADRAAVERQPSPCRLDVNPLARRAELPLIVQSSSVPSPCRRSQAAGAMAGRNPGPRDRQAREGRRDAALPSNTLTAPPPLTVRSPAPGPSITSGPDVSESVNVASSVIVSPWRRPGIERDHVSSVWGAASAFARNWT